MNLHRRDFLKALGLSSGTSAIGACGIDANRYMTPVENVLPYVVKPDQVTPGTPTFFATSVLRGPHAHAATARHRDGRVINVGHNPMAPGRPSVSTSELMELQKHYSPDRLQAPQADGAATTWEAGLSTLATAVREARAAGKQVAYLGAYRSGALVELLDQVTEGHAVYWEPTGYEAEVAAAEALFGRRTLPFYDLGDADYILSFGAPFLGSWGDAAIEDRYALARDPNHGHGIVRFALVAPFRDQTGVNSDDWLACAPGSEVLVARALAARIASDKGVALVGQLAGGVTLEAAAQASGLSVEDLEGLVAHLTHGQAVVLPGGASGDADLAAATYLLNLALGAAPGRFHLGGYAGPVSGWSELSALLADCKAGKVGVLIVDEANPVYALPDAAGAAEALKAVGLVVGVSSHTDETTALASLLLPTSDAFEDWGDEQPVAGLRLLRQPAASPLYDTRSLGDVLLATARAAGLQAPEGSLGFAAPTWREYLAAVWARDLHQPAVDGAFGDFWEKSVIQGFWQGDAGDVTPALVAESYAWADAAPVAGDLVLLTHAHPLRKDGRYANQPWAQEVGDALTGMTWDSWLEVSHETAEALGLAPTGKQQRSGEFPKVSVTTDGGTVELPLRTRRGIKAGIAVLALGNGHVAAGRYADGYGVNAAKLFALAAGSLGAFAWRGQSAKVGDTGTLVKVATTYSNYDDTDQGRQFGMLVDAGRLAEHGDAPAAHAGELTGIHHLELDSRLAERDVEGFYTTPDHSTYRFGMTVDTNACTGCGACLVACYAENNLPVVGKGKLAEGREMAWIRLDRFWETAPDGTEQMAFVPMMCQHCGHAGCENVCPVLATYHNIDGLNAMVYNRCVGTRYCSNACPFSVRRFNYHTYHWPEPFNLQLNPDVSVRTVGVMEKCTFCVQRIRQVKSAAKDGGNFTATVPDEAWRQVPACAEACPTQAMTFGNLNDPEGACSQSRKSGRTYEPLADIRPLSAVNYLARATFHGDPTAHHGGGHGGGHEAAGEHAATHEGGSHEAPAHEGEAHEAEGHEMKDHHEAGSAH